MYQNVAYCYQALRPVVPALYGCKVTVTKPAVKPYDKSADLFSSEIQVKCIEAWRRSCLILGSFMSREVPVAGMERRRKRLHVHPYVCCCVSLTSLQDQVPGDVKETLTRPYLQPTRGL